MERFLNLEVEVAGGRVIPIGRNVLTKLANSKQRGGDGAAERSAGQGIVPKMVVGLIRERGAHAVVWHPIQNRYQFASDFHASAAIELLRSQSPNIWAWLRRVFRRGPAPHSLSQNSRDFVQARPSNPCRIHKASCRNASLVRVGMPLHSVKIYRLGEIQPSTALKAQPTLVGTYDAVGWEGFLLSPRANI